MMEHITKTKTITEFSSWWIRCRSTKKINADVIFDNVTIVVLHYYSYLKLDERLLEIKDSDFSNGLVENFMVQI